MDSTTTRVEAQVGGDSMNCYPVLSRELRECKYKQSDIAGALGITVKALYNKLNGKTEFTWSEVCTIIKQFFPYYDPLELFARAEQDSA